MWSLVLGVALAVLGTLTGATVTELVRDKRYASALLFVVVGIACEFGANVFVSGIVVSAFGGLVVVWSAAFAHARRERIEWRGAVVIALGCAGIAFAAPPPEKWTGLSWSTPLTWVFCAGAALTLVAMVAPTAHSFDASFRPGCVGGFVRVGMRAVEQAATNDDAVAVGVAVALTVGMGAAHAWLLLRALRTTRAFVVNAILVPTQVVVGTVLLSLAFSELDETSVENVLVLVASLVAIGAGSVVVQLRVPSTLSPLKSSCAAQDVADAVAVAAARAPAPVPVPAPSPLPAPAPRSLPEEDEANENTRFVELVASSATGTRKIQMSVR